MSRYPDTNADEREHDAESTYDHEADAALADEQGLDERAGYLAYWLDRVSST